MQKKLILPSLLLLSACGGGDNDGGDTAAPSVAPDSTSSTMPAAVTVHKLPWDIPIMPGARYISGSPKFSKPSKRRGGDAIATIAVKGTPKDIVSYYEKTLAERGFTLEVGKYNDDSTATVHGTNAKGEKFAVSAMRGGSNSKPGESSAALVATKPKQSE